jgi:murein DD-endopeptidase MepM/ murein hydrolase activator NlpD
MARSGHFSGLGADGRVAPSRTVRSMVRAAGRAALGVLLAGVLAGCGTASATRDRVPRVANGSTITVASTTATLATTTTTLPPTTTTTAPPPPPGRAVVDGRTVSMAGIAEVLLVHPSAAVERVGFHQSSNDGAMELIVLPSAIAPATLNTRARGTGDRTAADVVVQPGTTVYAPVSGTVVKAGGYRLYCAYDDETVVVEPDAHPGWHVVMLHVQGVLVAAGGRVEAGVTPVATQAHQLPFRSQVDKLATASPPWPHVHVEIDDPAVADAPSKGDSC